MIRVANLTKRYGRTRAVDNLSFEVKQGEIAGLLGPNGAGKTTTLRILACFLPATEGTALIAGLDIFQNSLEVRRLIGYLPENVPLYPEMRVREYLRFRAGIRGIFGRKRRERIREVVAACGLEGSEKQVIGRLSKGYRQRVGLADCLLHEPPVLILDEPTLGLDPNQIRHARNLIKSLAPRHTVLLSTHILAEAEMTCHRVLIMNKGRIVASDTPERLMTLGRGVSRVIAEISGPRDEMRSKIEALPFVERVSVETNGDWHGFTIETPEGEAVRSRVFDLAAQNRWDLRELRWEKQGLEDAFASVTEEARPS